MEYPDSCSTAMRHIARKVGERWLLWKVGLYDLEVVPPWEHYFQTGELAYDSIPPLGLSLQSPIGFIQESCDGTYVNNT